jgi:1,4-alpha-glucan branching enzyme
LTLGFIFQFSILVIPAVPLTHLEPLQQHFLHHDLRGGAHFNLVAPGTVTFVLYAPHKPYASLVGDFNDWNTLATRMVTDGQGVWWVTIPHPGATRYGFYVAVDEQSHVWVGDPYAKEVRWEGECGWGWLPDVGPGHRWQTKEWQTPSLRDLIIYELCVRDFTGDWQGGTARFGNFQRLCNQIPYLADLGINAIELMPIQAFPGESSWGYNPVFYFAPAAVYGRPDDLKRLVDICHFNGIAVILDVAFNHAWGQHPYYQMYPPMFAPDGTPLQDLNPFFHHTPPAVNMWGGVDWDHFSACTTRHFQDVVRFWLQEYRIDGFRFDWVCGVDYDSNDPMAPGFNPFHGIEAICWAARQEKPDCILIGEFWQLEGTHPEKSAAKLMYETSIDACWNGVFHHTLDDILNQRWQWEKRDIFRAMAGFREMGYREATQLVNYTASHDEVRPEHEIKYYSGRHIKRPPGVSLQKLAMDMALLGLVTLLCAPGIPLLYAGQEFAEDAPRTIDFCPINWQKLRLPPHREHMAAVTRLVQARRRCSALRSDEIEFFANDFAADKLVRFVRGGGWDEQVFVALNFDSAAKPVSMQLPHGGAWCDVVSGRKMEFQQGEVDLVLGPWQSLVLTPV